MNSLFDQIYNDRMSQIKENVTQADIKGFIDQNINSLLANVPKTDKGKIIDALTHLKDVGGVLQYQPELDIKLSNEQPTSGSTNTSQTDSSESGQVNTQTTQTNIKQPSPEDMKKTTMQTAEYATAANAQNVLAGYKKG